MLITFYLSRNILFEITPDRTKIIFSARKLRPNTEGNFSQAHNSKQYLSLNVTKALHMSLHSSQTLSHHVPPIYL